MIRNTIRNYDALATLFTGVNFHFVLDAEIFRILKYIYERQEDEVNMDVRLYFLPIKSLLLRS